jgi:hypothetical protein
MLHLFYNFKKTQEAQKIRENELPGNSIGKTQKSQEDVMKNFIHVMMLL